MLGDLVAQGPEISKGKAWDARRTAKMGAFGVALHGPIGHYWYGFLDRTIMTAAPTSAAAVASKTAIDQIFWAPIFTSVFFGSMKLMDGKPNEITTEVKEKLWPTMKVNWTVYVFASAHTSGDGIAPPLQRLTFFFIRRICSYPCRAIPLPV